MGEHLSEEQLFDTLLGDSNPERERHLAHCKDCSAELALLHSSVTGFQELGSSWAVAEAVRQVPVPSRFSLQVGAKMGMTWALTALAACAMAIVVIPRLQTPSKAGFPTREDEPSVAEIQRDNLWLAAMDRDLRSEPDLIGTPSAAPEILHHRRQGGRVVSD